MSIEALTAAQLATEIAFHEQSAEFHEMQARRHRNRIAELQGQPQGIERFPVVKRGGEIRCLKGCPTVDDDCDAAGHPIASGWPLGGEARQLDTAEAVQ